MLPILLDVGFIKIYTFGVFLVLAFFWGGYFLWKNVALTSYKEDEVFDGVFIGLIGGAIIGRIVYIASHFNDFGFNILKYILINGYPGMHLFGAVVGFFLFLYIFINSKKIPYNRLIDYVIPAILLSVAIGKLGAFFSGAEIGSQTSFPISLTYESFDGTRHLTSLYESILFFIGTFISYKILMDIRREKYFEGYNFLIFLLIYSFILFIFDPLKSFRVMVYGISVDWVIHGIILLTVSVYVLYYLRTSLMRILLRKQK